MSSRDVRFVIRPLLGPQEEIDKFCSDFHCEIYKFDDHDGDDCVYKVIELYPNVTFFGYASTHDTGIPGALFYQNFVANKYGFKYVSNDCMVNYDEEVDIDQTSLIVNGIKSPSNKEKESSF